MRSVGVDIASAGPSGFALVVDRELVYATSWKPPNKDDSEPQKLLLFYRWIKAELFIARPDIVSVERHMGYSKNQEATTMIGRREGIALLVARQRGCIVQNPGISMSRKSVFGKGNLSKDQCWALRATIWPDFDFGPKTTGGTDCMDAATHALAGPINIERRK